MKTENIKYKDSASRAQKCACTNSAEALPILERKFKDSGIPWIGEIPSDWEVVPIKRVKDKTHPYPIGDGDHGSIKPDDYRDEGIPYIRVQNMSWGGPIIMDNIAYISEEVNAMNRKSELHPNDILVAKTGATIGKTCIIPENMLKANTTSSVGKVTVGKDFSSKFVFYLLGSEVCIRQMWLKAGQKSAQPGFNIDELVDFKIPISKDFSTQQRIADYLDRKCAEIDELAALQETMIAELKRYKQSVITEAVTKGLDKNVKFKDSGVEWIGEIPEGWEVTRFYKVNNIRGRLGWKGLKAEEYQESGYPFLSAFNINNDKLDWSDLNFINKDRYDESPEIKLSVGDVLIVKDGAGIGKCARVSELPYGESTVNSSIAVITPPSFLDYGYLYYYILSNPFQRVIWFLKIGMGVPHLTQENMRNIKMPFPPLTEQQAIADYLDEKCSEIDELIAIKQQKIEQLKEYKKSVIFEYVTGKKEVQR